jgi:predicted RNase H-like HicB family nuclease
MNKNAIANTAITYWCKDDKCYLRESPLFDSVLGVGDTPEEAEQTFSDLLDDAYEAYLEGRVPGYASPGRPTKGGIALNSDVKPATKKKIKELAEKFDCSTGEVVDYLLFSFEHSSVAQPKMLGKGGRKVRTKSSLSGRMAQLEENVAHLMKVKSPLAKTAKRRAR